MNKPKHKIGDTVYYNSFGKIKSFVITNIVDVGDGNPFYEDNDGSGVFEKALLPEHEYLF